jgi:hypothetical protein
VFAEGVFLKSWVLFALAAMIIGCEKNSFEVTRGTSRLAIETQDPEARRVQLPTPPPAKNDQEPKAPQVPTLPQTTPAPSATPSVPNTAGGGTQTPPQEFKPGATPTPLAPNFVIPNGQPATPNLVPNADMIPDQTSAEEKELEIEPTTEFDKRPLSKEFHQSGKPKFSYTERLKRRFGAILNKAKPMESLSRKDQDKWKKIFDEIQKVANTEAGAPKRLLFIDKKDAIERSKSFEKDGVSSPEGAHTIAVDATAPRHGFGNRPCAEFMSEIIRQAYQRAGIALNEDFNSQERNELVWSETAAVEGLRNALTKAGWTMWDTAEYKPMMGAVMMHQVGDTPGHTYMSGSDNGLVVIDNGSPRGRDLKKSTLKLIKFMYHGGLFLLPPGITPTKWSSQ